MARRANAGPYFVVNFGESVDKWGNEGLHFVVNFGECLDKCTPYNGSVRK